VRELGLTPVPLPAAPVHLAARAVSRLPWPPFIPPALGWVEALSHPSIMDTTKARDELGFTPRYSAREALRATFSPGG
jgi:nucleoside-diphosphate-sugar epimerase